MVGDKLNPKNMYNRERERERGDAWREEEDEEEEDLSMSLAQKHMGPNQKSWIASNIFPPPQPQLAL